MAGIWNDIFNSSSSGSGEANTASNVGTSGLGVFKQKTGVDLEFKNLNSSSNLLTVSEDTPNNLINFSLKNNEAVVNPTVTDDSSLNYVVSSRWINTNTEEEFVCLNNSVGAAHWVSTTADVTGELYTPAISNNWGQTPPINKSQALDFLVNVNLEPQIYYVNRVSGHNLNSGSYYAPFATLQRAIDVYLSLNSGNRVTIRLVSSISSSDTLHLDTGLHVYPGSYAPNLTIESATNERLVVECDVNVFGTKGITLNFNNIYLTTQALSPGAPNLQIVQTTGNQFFISFDNCELNRLEVNSEGIIFTNIKYMAFRQSVFRNGLIADVLFTNVNFLVFYDSLIDPFSPLSFNNIYFISTGVICKIVMMSAGMPQADVVSDGVIPPFWYRHFNGKNPEFAVSGGGQIRIGIASEIFGSSVAPALTLVSGVTLELLNCKCLSNIVVDAGATLDTRACGQLNDITNNGTWTDRGSNYNAVFGTGTFLLYDNPYFQFPRIVTAATDTITNADKEVKFDATSNSILETMPDCTTFPVGKLIYFTRKPGGSSNTVTFVSFSVGQTFDNLTSIQLPEYQRIGLINEGTYWGIR